MFMTAESHPVVAAKTRVFIIDDHPITRAGYAALISRQPDLEICGEAADAPEAIARLRGLSPDPDVAVVDISLRSGSGIELCKHLAKLRPRLHLLAVSAHDERVYAERALRAGAKGYLPKGEAAERLVQALRAVREGRVVLSSEMTSRILGGVCGAANESGDPGLEALSDRELEVFEAIGRGRTTQQIARDMHLSPKTVESYRENLKKKLGIARGPELLRLAVEWVLGSRGGI